MRSLWLGADADPKVVQRILGHASFTGHGTPLARAARDVIKNAESRNPGGNRRTYLCSQC